MLIEKIYYHLFAIFKIIIYRLSYGKQVSFGKRVTFRSGFHIDIDSEYKGKIRIGDGCFFNRGCTLSSQGVIVIGRNCLFGENVKVYDHNHKFYLSESIRKQGYSVGELHIGNNCWIGSSVVFLKGASVGEGCIIGAGCVIDSVIPANTIVKANRELNFVPIIRDE